MDIRKIKSHEFEQAIKLSDEVFRDGEQISMGEAFPHVFSKELNQSFGAFDGEKLVSFIGLVPAKIKVENSELTVFSIGSVCTHKEYRKRGISSAILKEIYQYIDEAGASLLFVSGDRGMYKRNHCYHFGGTNKYTLNMANVNKSKYEGEIRKANPVDIFKVASIKEEKKVRFKSSLWEWSTLLKAGGYTSIYKLEQDLFVAENDREVEGYVVIGLPNDISSKEQAITIEWGGEPEVVHAILLSLLESNMATEIEITIPWHEKYHEEFSEYLTSKQNHGGTIYLVNIKRLMEQTKSYLKNKNSKLVQDLDIIQIEGDKFELTYDEKNITLTRKELVEMLFNVKDKSIANELQTIFPVPLPSPEGLYYV